MDLEHTSQPPARFIAAIVIGATLIPLNSTMIAVALPAIGETFQVSPGDLTLWLVTSYLLISIIFQSPGGMLGDLLGRRRAFVLGISLFILGVLAATLIPSLYAVSASRVLMAAGGAMLMPNAMALLRDAVPEHRRARVFGYFGALLSASAAVGPLIGGVLTRYFGWEAIFLVNLPILLLSWILLQSEASYGRRNTRANTTASRFDFIGMGLFAIGLGSLVLGLKSDGSWPLVAMVCSALGLFAFVQWERRTATPLIDLQLFRRLPFVIGGSLVGLQNLGMYALLFQLPFLLQEWYQLGPVTIGRILLTMTLFMVLFASLGGRIAERFGSRFAIMGGLGISLAGMLLLLYTTGPSAIGWMTVSLACVGTGIGIVSGPAQATALSVVSSTQSGAASGLLSTMRYLGGVAGIAIISTILADPEPADLLAQNKLCFGIYAGVYFFALLLAAGLPQRVKLSA